MVTLHWLFITLIGYFVSFFFNWKTNHKFMFCSTVSFWIKVDKYMLNCHKNFRECYILIMYLIKSKRCKSFTQNNFSVNIMLNIKEVILQLYFSKQRSEPNWLRRFYFAQQHPHIYSFCTYFLKFHQKSLV